MVFQGKKLKPGLEEAETSLHKKAEGNLLGKSSSSNTELGGMAPDELRRKLHDLQVHQLELELQNEELRKTQLKLETARSRYFDLYDLAPVGCCTVNEYGVISEANLTIATLLGIHRGLFAWQSFNRFIFAEDLDIYYLKHKQLDLTGKGQTFELRMVKNGGDVFWAQITMTTAQDENGKSVYRIALNESPERKLLETSKEIFREILLILCESGDWRQSLQKILGTLRTKAGVDAAAVLLQEQDASHCLVQDGFPDDFLLPECPFVKSIVEGQGAQDHNCNLRQECICDLILSRKTEPAYPAYSEAGSIWLNEFCCILDITPCKTLYHPEKICINQGFSSVAMVPIRSKDRIVGLIQLNDRQKGRFSLNSIELLEVIGSHIGTALVQKQYEEVLQESEERFRNLFTQHSAVMLIIDKETGNIIEANSAAVRFYGWSIDALKKMRIQEINALPDEVEKAIMLEALKSQSFRLEFPHRIADGSIHDVDVFCSCIHWGERSVLFSIIHDITERKMAESALRMNERRLQLALDIAQIGICDWDVKNSTCLSSPSYYAMLGYAPTTGPEDNSLWLTRIHPKDRDAVAERIVEFSQLKRKEFQYETRMSHADGSCKWHRVIGNVVERDQDNKPLRLISARMDITEQREAELLRRNYGHQLVSAIENERAQIARDLHDGIGQDITALSFDVKKTQNKVSLADAKPEEVERYFNIIFDDIKNISVSIHHICSNLKPMLLDDLGLIPAIEWLAGELTKKSGVQIDNNFPCILCRYREQSTHIFRIVQEALNNSLKHARATSILISCNRLAVGCAVEVSDNGCGYIHDKLSGKTSFGIRGMYERADMLKARLEWKKSAVGGTTVSLYLPEQCQTERERSCDI